MVAWQGRQSGVPTVVPGRLDTKAQAVAAGELDDLDDVVRILDFGDVLGGPGAPDRGDRGRVRALESEAALELRTNLEYFNTK